MDAIRETKQNDGGYICREYTYEEIVVAAASPVTLSRGRSSREDHT